MTLHLSHFDGPVMPGQSVSLHNQIERIYNLMKDGRYRTLDEIQRTLESNYPNSKFPTSSISAQLRNLKKEKFGGHGLERWYKGNGLYEYKIIPNLKWEQMELFK